MALGQTSFHSTPGKVRAAKSKQLGGSPWGTGGPQQSLARACPHRGALSVCPPAIGVSLREKSSFKLHSLETVFSYFWTQVPTCLQTYQTGGFPIHPLCLAPLLCASQPAGCVSTSTHTGDMGPARRKLTVRVALRAPQPTTALCALITCIWYWVALPVTNRRRTGARGAREEEWPDERMGSAGLQELKGRAGWTEQTAPGKCGAGKPGHGPGERRERLCQRGRGMPCLVPAHFSSL